MEEVRAYDMHRRKAVLVISVCFYSAMLVLALCSRWMYRAKLPRVRICYLEQMAFWEDGEYSYFPALPESLYNRPLYYVAVEKKNKEMCYIVKMAENVVLGEEKDGYYAVKGGVSVYLPLIVESDADVTEGQEVLVENEEELMW